MNGINKSNPTIRTATEADADLVAKLINTSFQDVAERFSLTPQNCPKHPSNCTTAWIRADLERGVEYFILYDQDKPVGCVGLESPNSDLRYLERLAVLPEFRKQGFGHHLVAHAISHASQDHATRINIGIIADDIELKEWYIKRGFVEGEIKTFPHLPFQVRFLELNLSYKKTP